MTNDSPLTRRRMLQVTGSAAAIGLAGCSGSPTNNVQTEPGDESTPTPSEQPDEHDDAGGEHDEGDGHDDDHDEAIGEPTDSAEVAMVTRADGDHFEPHVVRANVGGSVTFVNESGSHSATAYHPDNDQPQLVPDGAASWDSGLLVEEGATFEHTFETEGVYHYYCTPHESVGMIGSVIVGEPDAHGQPALEDPPADKPDRVREKITELNQMCNEALGHMH